MFSKIGIIIEFISDLITGIRNALIYIRDKTFQKSEDKAKATKDTSDIDKDFNS